MNNVFDGMGTLVKFNSAMMEINAEVNMYKLEHMLARIQRDDTINLFPPIEDSAVKSKTMCARS